MPQREMPEFLDFGAMYTPSTHVFAADATYCRYFWLPHLGPTGYLAWQALVAWLPDEGDATASVGFRDLSGLLGVAPRAARHSIERLVSYRFARWDGDVLRLHRRMSQCGVNHLARLAERAPGLAGLHDEILAASKASVA